MYVKNNNNNNKTMCPNQQQQILDQAQFPLIRYLLFFDIDCTLQTVNSVWVCCSYHQGRVRVVIVGFSFHVILRHTLGTDLRCLAKILGHLRVGQLRQGLDTVVVPEDTNDTQPYIKYCYRKQPVIFNYSSFHHIHSYSTHTSSITFFLQYTSLVTCIIFLILSLSFQHYQFPISCYHTYVHVTVTIMCCFAPQLNKLYNLCILVPFFRPPFTTSIYNISQSSLNSRGDAVLVLLDLVNVKQPGRGRVLGVPNVSGGGGVDVGLSDDRQTRVYRSRLVDVKRKVRILDHIHPEPQGHTERMRFT